MKPTTYSHERSLSGEMLDMYVRLQLINAATDGGHSASLSEYPDLAQPQLQPATAAGGNPDRQAVVSQAQLERPIITSAIPTSVVVPPVERPRTVTASSVIDRTEEETHLEEQRIMGIDALARANREAL